MPATVENRWSPRKTAVIDAVLHERALGFVRCRCRNLSLQGAFIEMGLPLPPLDATVDLDFVASQDGVSRLHHVRAKVIRHADDGVGLLFSDFRPQLDHFLEQVYHGRAI